ncbi:GGDEF domain-containing protein [Pseudomonas sp. BGr12]|uniref:diguanylate cyclase n=1 Tax=Pseudomonas denitrificans TaxID=43306 RepID=A0A9X7N3L3_PSEDE|nr:MULTISPECIES: GGDEF domain-containing protein [Pseudomonadaceae]OQR37034.1 GGDEF domain-containing protein [Pseudomonas sp. T]MBD9499624.1 diguanylate cyclase [Pseudomonas sp. PDM17]MBD9512874.1 diguanylate cyclase [Pseudomonas sp. PDM22]MBD9575632.1 diguanylate cyclase [Pseudomonas sp. PDM23]MBD9669426.1 diguanylate cyclase [Pseudomonas sp. PDM21]
MHRNSDPDHLFDSSAGPTGLEEADHRLLMRLIFGCTGATLGLFSILQYLAGNLWLAGAELVTCGLLLWAAHRLQRVRRLVPWIIAYLLPTFCFILYIIVMPNASASAFVWVYLMPVMAYLLLGKWRGFLLAVPFMLIATLMYLHANHLRLDAPGLIDIGNGIFCGVLVIAFMHVYEERRAAAYKQLRHLALTDALTGVASRESFQRALRRCIQEAARYETRLVLVVLDVDHFKNINDQWGHDAGDKALQHLCNRLRHRLRATDLIGRLGGEEFGLLLPFTDRFDAKPLVESLRRDIDEAPLMYHGERIEISATFGLAEWPGDGLDADELYRCTDRRLYRGKAEGRNRLVYSDPA